MTIPNPKKERVIVYVDGFNLYFGMRSAGYHNCRWLNLYSLAQSLLKPNQILTEVKYFTSRVSNDPAKQKRQNAYIEALELSGVKIYYGHYQSGTMKCNKCGYTWPTYSEKMTDVNIATQMLVDACMDNFDMAMLISGDSDLVPPINSIHQSNGNKRVLVAFPPSRHNSSVANAAKGSFIIGRKKLVDNQFDDELTKPDGFVLKKPTTWQ